jgi:capsid protein
MLNAIRQKIAAFIAPRNEHRAIAPQARARYDAASTTTENAQYFAQADGFSARAANSPAVRQILRNRSRYEIENNSYAKGLVTTLTDYIIGTGPTLQVLTDDDAFNAWYEDQFNTWMKETSYGSKLWTVRHAQIQDGEGFGYLVNNPQSELPVKLDMIPIEADQVSDGQGNLLDLRNSDGIVRDNIGNVISYRILPEHPGDWSSMAGGAPVQIAARRMFHLYRATRPGQMRGVPEITAGLMLYPVLRRYTYAALHAAETAARISGVLQTKFSPDEAPDVPELEPTDIQINQWMTLPEGWELKQIASEHPSTTYPQFKKEVVIEAARGLCVPANIALGTSEGYNYSSGKLDHVGFYKSVGIQQEAVQRVACEPTLKQWHAEARAIRGYAPSQLPETIPPHVWIWDGQEIIDPRENSGQVEALANGLDSIARLHAKRGLRTDNVFRANAQALGMSVEEYKIALRNKLFNITTPAPATIDPDTGEEQVEPEVNGTFKLKGIA